MKHYYVFNSFNDAEWHNFSIGVSYYYEDSFDVGEFVSDAEAIEAVERLQAKHDNAASKALVEAGYDGDLGTDGPCYVNHLYRKEDDGNDVKVER